MVNSTRAARALNRTVPLVAVNLARPDLALNDAVIVVGGGMLGLAEAEGLLDGEGDSEALALGDSEVEGLSEADGDSLADSLALGLTDNDSDVEGLGEALSLADSLGDGDRLDEMESDGLRLKEVEGLVEADSLAEALDDGLMEALDDALGLCDWLGERLALPLDEGD